MKKPDEIEFRKLVEEDRAAGNLTPVEEIGERIGMNHKRALFLVRKWKDWEWGVSASRGWFREHAVT